MVMENVFLIGGRRSLNFFFPKFARDSPDWSTLKRCDLFRFIYRKVVGIPEKMNVKCYCEQNCSRRSESRMNFRKDALYKVRL